MRLLRINFSSIGIIIGLMVIFFLIISCGKDYSDQFKITSVSYTINSDQSGKVTPGEKISFSSGDKLSLQELEFNSEIASDYGAWAEAYLHDSKIVGAVGIINNNGQFTYGRRNITHGKNILAFKQGSWDLKEPYDQFIVILIYQFGKGDADYQKVDTVAVNLSYQK